MFKQIFKANPYHDEAGRFTFAEGAHFTSGWAYGPKLTRARAKALGRGPKARVKDYSKMSEEQKFDRIGKEGKFLEGKNVKFSFTAREWNELSPNVSPRELVEAMVSKESLEGGNLKGTLSRYAAQKIMFIAEKGSEVHGAEVEYMQRTFDMQTKDVHHDYLKLPKDSQGGGVIKKFFGEAVPLYKKMGIKSISVGANLDAGGYAWGRYGFASKRPDMYSVEVQSGAGRVLTKIEEHLKYKKKTQLPPEARAEFDRIKAIAKAAKNDPLIPNHVTSIKTPELNKLLKEAEPSSKKTFMQDALFYKSWDGYINFSDQTQMEMLSSYIKKKV